VTRVELKVTEQRVEVWAGHPESVRWPCPECARPHAAGPLPRTLEPV